VIDVLWKLITHSGSDFDIALTFVPIGSCKSLQIRDRLNIPNNDRGRQGNILNTNVELGSENLGYRRHRIRLNQ